MADYDFVFDEWDARRGWFDCGWRRVFWNGLPYVQFHVIGPELAVWVRCDPCSLDQNQDAYKTMVRTDLLGAIEKARRTS